MAGSPVDPARGAAYDVLRTVREQEAYTNLVLPQLLRARGIRDRDAAFATELVSGTIRRQGLYDAVVAANVDRPLAKVDPGVLDALRLGTHQLLSMRVPTHAAVGTTVDLVRAKVGHRPSGFANAVLRKVARHDLDGWVRRIAPDPATDPVGFAAVAHAHPRWVVEALAEALGPAEAELEALLAADNVAPRVTLVARPGLATVDELVAAGAEASPLSPYAATLPGGDPAALAAVAEGRAGVQDEGSQLVALAVAAAVVEGRDDRWLDVCAGPGGKAALLAAVAGERGARLLAGERLPHRAELVRAATAAAGPGLLGVVAADGTRPAWAPETFDRVLVDAPCSGLGALRRRPEARWRKEAADLDGLVQLQEALLDGAMEAVRPGGVVGYVTCSPVLAETAGVVSALLGRRDDVRLEDASPLLPGVTDAAGPLAGTVQLWPHRHGTDAMFLALLRRA
ncbi:MAG TPA: transcription antitermination factor NusB [Nocardioides sp.]|uniref:RsmB/NOP family class I SAM-dependent RNA methyltransferase n=1 Tax=Nocardioides sp. TaxID=35761 RepID=UPI002D8092B4|nr:transcription antitermination factor NusB [Nocardioides sp.]HET6652683.1 transcription antitermination factor NusB [Nocardioides sp.]